MSLHPAAGIAVERIAETDSPAAARGLIELEDGVVVLVDGQAAQYVVYVDRSPDGCSALSYICGRADPPTTREKTTVDDRPISRPSTSYIRSLQGNHWYTLTGIAAEDAIMVEVVSRSQPDAAFVPVDAKGLVFAAVRVLEGEKPYVCVYTNDGRAIPVPDVWL